MAEPDLNNLDALFSRLDQRLIDIKETQGRQEKALVEIFQANRDYGAKLSSLDTVVRMSLAEQKRVNETVREDIRDLEQCDKDLRGRWEKKDDQIDTRMRNTERRLAYFAGGLAVLLLIFDLGIRFGVNLFFSGGG